ncbi:MAG: pyridoxamine 5'-phosphate oxidase family protein [Chloroflexota bacterium]
METGHGQIEEMNLEESQFLLRKAKYGRLGLAFESEPYVVPVSHIYDGEQIWFHVSKVGKKTTYLQANPQICFQVDEWIDSGWGSVICYGTVSLSDEPTVRREFMKLALDQGLSDEQLEQMDMYVCRLAIEEMTGRKSPGYSQEETPPGPDVTA